MLCHGVKYYHMLRPSYSRNELSKNCVFAALERKCDPSHVTPSPDAIASKRWSTRVPSTSNSMRQSSRLNGSTPTWVSTCCRYAGSHIWDLPKTPFSLDFGACTLFALVEPPRAHVFNCLELEKTRKIKKTHWLDPCQPVATRCIKPDTEKMKNTTAIIKQYKTGVGEKVWTWLDHACHGLVQVRAVDTAVEACARLCIHSAYTSDKHSHLLRRPRSLLQNNKINHDPSLLGKFWDVLRLHPASTLYVANCIVFILLYTSVYPWYPCMPVFRRYKRFFMRFHASPKARARMTQCIWIYYTFKNFFFPFLHIWFLQTVWRCVKPKCRRRIVESTVTQTLGRIVSVSSSICLKPLTIQEFRNWKSLGRCSCIFHFLMECSGQETGLSKGKDKHRHEVPSAKHFWAIKNCMRVDCSGSKGST